MRGGDKERGIIGGEGGGIVFIVRVQQWFQTWGGGIMP
jgi:hypothetical protein